MIKKNTKIIFESEGKATELKGGVPLSEGEIVQIKDSASKESTNFKVIKKEVEFIMQDEDQIANVTYLLKKI